MFITKLLIQKKRIGMGEGGRVKEEANSHIHKL